MKKLYDKDIRPLIYNKLAHLKEFSSDPSSIIIDELAVGDARIDIAVVNGKFHGIEIKSDFDSLIRLENQISFYNMVFDKITIIISEKFIDKVTEIVPNWWGIYIIDSSKNTKLKRIKIGKSNPCVNKLSLIRLLWKEELINFLFQKNIKKGIKSKNKNDLIHLINEVATLKEIQIYIRVCLKTRNLERAVLISTLNDG